MSNGGVPGAQERNEAKASLLYNEIDSNPLFEGTVAKEDRSNMNVTFLMKDDSRLDEFNALWQKNDLVGLKGHRSVGGFRASMYNALPIESVKVLVDLMKHFSSKG
jgi:phosphoserine aminotransferase